MIGNLYASFVVPLYMCVYVHGVDLEFLSNSCAFYIVIGFASTFDFVVVKSLQT